MGIDPRGPRFGALITLVVFAVVLVTGSVWLLAAQALDLHIPLISHDRVFDLYGVKRIWA